MTLFSSVGQKIANFFGENTDLDQLSEGKENHADFLDLDYFSDLLPYRIFDEKRKIYENKSSFGFVLEVIPLLGGFEEAKKELSSLIKEIGEEGTDIQCLSFADNRIDRFLDGWSKPRHEQGGIFKEIAEKREAFFKKESLKGDVPPRIFRFFFSYSQPKPQEKDLEFSLDKLVEKKSKAIQTFSRLSQAFEIEPFQLIELLSGLVNFDLDVSTQSRRSWNKNTWISKQVCLPGTAIEAQKEGLVFHGKDKKAFLRTYEVVDVPDYWTLSYMGELLGDFFNGSYRIQAPFYFQYGIHFPNQEKAELKFSSKSKLVEHQMKFPSIVRMVPELPRESSENFLVRKQLLEGEKFVETRFSCGIWAEKQNLVTVESTLRALFQKYGFKIKENDFVHLPDFLSCLPMSWGEDSAYIKNLKRIRSMRTTITQETASLIPCIGEWWGNSSKGMPLMGRRGQIATWDQFATDGNLNAVVVGPSGSGKSVFMAELIMSHLGQGGRVFVLDLGRSFEKLCHLVDGQFLEFSEKSRFNLNPFNFIKSDGDIDAVNSSMEIVSSIIATMAMPCQKIDKERANILNTVVKLAWEKFGSNASVDSVIELIDRIKFDSELMKGAAESLKEGLKKFSKTGAFSHYFYGSNTINFSNDLVVIETESLKTMADLQSVIMQMFTLTISNQIFMGDRNKRCLICIDEAWDLLKSPQMEGFIESLARRLRKYNGALVVGTQGLKDFESSLGAQAAFQNSNWLVMLGQDSNSINTIKKENLIPMNEYKERVLSSLRKEDGKYSEMFIHNKGTGFFSVARLKLDPFSGTLYSTSPEAFQAVQELQEQGLSIIEAVNWMIENSSSFKQSVQSGKKPKEAVSLLLKLKKQGDLCSKKIEV